MTAQRSDPEPPEGNDDAQARQLSQRFVRAVFAERRLVGLILSDAEWLRWLALETTISAMDARRLKEIADKVERHTITAATLLLEHGRGVDPRTTGLNTAPLPEATRRALRDGTDDEFLRAMGEAFRAPERRPLTYAEADKVLREAGYDWW